MEKPTPGMPTGRKKCKDDAKTKRDPPPERPKSTPLLEGQIVIDPPTERPKATPHPEKPTLSPPRVRTRYPSPLATYTQSKTPEQSNKFGEKLIEMEVRAREARETKNSYKSCKNKVTNTNSVTKTNNAVSESELELLLEANENLDNNSNSSNTSPKTSPK